MSVVTKIVRAQTRDALRSRWLIVYATFFFLLTEGVIRFSGDGAKAILTLASATLIVVPLVTLVLSTIHVYNAREFTELLARPADSPVGLFKGLYLGLAVPLGLRLSRRA
jgi:Cu-processing system permease protein